MWRLGLGLGFKKRKVVREGGKGKQSLGARENDARELEGLSTAGNGYSLIKSLLQCTSMWNIAAEFVQCKIL